MSHVEQLTDAVTIMQRELATLNKRIASPTMEKSQLEGLQERRDLLRTQYDDRLRSLATVKARENRTRRAAEAIRLTLADAEAALSTATKEGDTVSAAVWREEIALLRNELQQRTYQAGWV